MHIYLNQTILRLSEAEAKWREKNRNNYERIELMAIELVFQTLTIEQDIDGYFSNRKRIVYSPWTREAFIRELTSNPFALYIVLEYDGKLLAYGGVWIILDEAHITNMLFCRNYRGMKLVNNLCIK